MPLNGFHHKPELSTITIHKCQSVSIPQGVSQIVNVEIDVSEWIDLKQLLQHDMYIVGLEKCLMSSLTMTNCND